MTVKWAPVEDGEYNEHSATIDEQEVSVFSDAGGQRWTAIIEGGWNDLEAATLPSALAEAEKLARS